MSDRERAGALPTSGSQGEFGGVTYIRPGTGRAERCPAGHLRELSGPTSSFNHAAGMLDYSCELCQRLGDPRWSWTVIDPSHQVTAADKPSGLTLVRIPPPRPASPGRIQLQLDDAILGVIDVALCRVEKRAVLERLAVQEKYRRRGAGRVLVAAALALGTGYDWSMVKLDNSLAARVFWARLGLVCGPAAPFYCSHMNDAAGRQPT